MTRFPSLPLWTDAWTAGTRHLTDAQRGILLSLLILMWEAPQCRIPNDDEWLARRLCTGPTLIRACCWVSS